MATATKKLRSALDDVKNKRPIRSTNKLANCQPRADRVVVRLDEAETTSPGGIVVVSAEKQRPSTGVVVKVGPGRPLSAGGFQPIDLKPGDHVMFIPFAGMSVENGITRDNDHLLLREEDIVAVLDD